MIINFRFTSLLITLIASIELSHGVINGKAAETGDFNHQVLLLYHDWPACGATVIDELHVVTAAHCLYGHKQKAYTIIAGVKHWESQETNIENGYVRSISEVFLHPDYKPAYNATQQERNNGVLDYPENDIAVLLLNDSLPIGGRIEKIALPNSEPFYTGVCSVAGWGSITPYNRRLSNDLMWSETQSLDPEVCEIYGAPHRDNELCTMSFNTPTSICQGDSGSGLICNNMLVGVSSGSWCDPQLPVTYAKVYDFLDFIDEARGLSSNVLSSNIEASQV